MSENAHAERDDEDQHALLEEKIKNLPHSSVEWRDAALKKHLAESRYHQLIVEQKRKQERQEREAATTNSCTRSAVDEHGVPEQLIARATYDRLRSEARKDKMEFGKELMSLRQQLIRMEAEKERYYGQTVQLHQQINQQQMVIASLGGDSSLTSPRASWRKKPPTAAQSPKARDVRTLDFGVETSVELSPTSLRKAHTEDSDAAATAAADAILQHLTSRKETSDAFIFAQKVAIDQLSPILSASSALEEQQGEHERAVQELERQFSFEMDAMRTFYEDQIQQVQRECEKLKSSLTISHRTANVEAESARRTEGAKSLARIEKLEALLGRSETEKEKQRALTENLKGLLAERDSIVSRQASQLSRFQAEVTQLTKERQEMKAALAALANDQMPWHVEKLTQAQRMEHHNPHSPSSPPVPGDVGGSSTHGWSPRSGGGKNATLSLGRQSSPSLDGAGSTQQFNPRSNRQQQQQLLQQPSQTSVTSRGSSARGSVEGAFTPRRPTKR